MDWQTLDVPLHEQRLAIAKGEGAAGVREVRPFQTTHNLPDIAQLAKEAGVGFEVRAADELTAGILGLLHDEEARREIATRARELIARHRGAARRCAQYVKQWIERTHHTRHALAQIKRV